MLNGSDRPREENLLKKRHCRGLYRFHKPSCTSVLFWHRVFPLWRLPGLEEILKRYVNEQRRHEEILDFKYRDFEQSARSLRT